MSKVDENKKLLSNIEENRPKSGSFEEIVCWDLGTMSSLLADISVSLAGICDSLELISIRHDNYREDMD